MKNQKGLTLIELIVAIAILGIVIIGALSMFTSGYKGIIGAGNRTESLYETSSKIEESLKTKPITGNSDVTIEFDTLSDITIEGDINGETETINGKKVIIYYFNPEE